MSAVVEAAGARRVSLDYRDLVIEELAAGEAVLADENHELRERLAGVEEDMHVWRLLALEALAVSHAMVAPLPAEQRLRDLRTATEPYRAALVRTWAAESERHTVTLGPRKKTAA